jgi:DNA-binding CsgD family transcriptional regulator
MATKARATARKRKPAEGIAAGPSAELYARGDLRLTLEFGEFLARTQPEANLDAVLLAASAAVRLGEDQRALKLTATLRANDVPGWRALEGFARAHAGEGTAGRRLLREALTTRNTAERADAALRLALLEWNDRKTEEAEEIVLQYLPSARGLNRCNLQQMLGWIESARERYAIAGRHFDAALKIYSDESLRDEWIRWRLIQAVSTLAAETLDFGLAPANVPVDGEIGNDAAEAATYALMNMSNIRLLEGRELEALEYLQRARAIAPCPALIAAVEVDLAAYHRLRGDRVTARDHLELARRHLGKTRWTDVNADQRMTLLEFAVEAYHLEPTAAGGPLMRFLSTDLKKRASLALERDGRVEAMELMARGVVDAVAGRRASARSILLEAREAWARIGYRYREITTLLLLHDLTGSPDDLEEARRAVEVAPRSWLYAEAEKRRQTETGPATLTPAERRVMLAICEGKTSKQIAAEFGRSFHTIRNQTLAVYQTMGVKTRAALVAECARLGLLREEK